MSKKEFNQGIQAGLRISEELLNKEAKAMDYLKNKMDGMALAQEEVKNAVNNVLELYTKDAVEKYYGICNALSPKDLQEPEQKVLLDILSTLAFQIENFSKSQKLYLSNLKQYMELGEYNPNVNYNFELIENIKDLDSQEIILKCVREFMFLENEDFSFDETIEEVLECFSIKTKIVRKIDDCISITHYIFGIDGIIQMYGNHSLEGFFEDDAEELFSLELEELCLEGDIVINKGEEKIYSKKLIRFNCNIECYGKLVFNECKLEYSKGKAITMYENSSIEIKDCFIKGCVSNDERDFFISTYDGEGTYFSITNTIFKDSNCFLQTGFQSEAYIDYCEIDNSIYLFNFYNGDVTIKNSIINTVRKYDKDHIVYRAHDDYLIYSGSGIDIINCRFNGYKDFDYSANPIYRDELILGDINKLYNCSFNKIKTRLSVKDMKLCNFTECANIVSDVLGDASNIKDCIFYKCNEVMPSCMNEFEMRGCQFIECIGRLCDLRRDSKVEQCEFINIKGERCATIEAFAYEKYDSSSMKNCTFKGVKLDDTFLIKASGVDRIKSPVLYLNDCKLECAKISNKLGKAVDDTKILKGMFGKVETIETVSLRDCSGFDNITHASGIYSDYVINEKNKNGESIGCSEDIKEGIAGKIASYINKGLATIIS